MPEYLDPTAVEAWCQAHLEVKRSRDGQLLAFCPLHDDHRPSLSVNAADAVACCHAGCEFGGTLSGLARAADLPTAGLLKDDLVDQVDRPAQSIEYIYRDAAGEKLFRVVRGPNKRFRQHAWDDGAWQRTLKRADGSQPPKVPYHLPELLEAKPDKLILWCEGEKDADRARQLGLVATTSPGGADGWRKLDTAALKLLKGRQVAIIPDNDKPGRAYAAHIKTLLEEAGARAELLELTRELPDKGDLSDWLEAGGTADQLTREMEKLFPLRTSFVSGQWAVDEARAYADELLRGVDKTGFVYSGLGPVDETFGGFRPGELIVIAGRLSSGKSAIALQLSWVFAQQFGPVYLETLELSRRQTLVRGVVQATGIPESKLTPEIVLECLPHLQGVYLQGPDAHRTMCKNRIREFANLNPTWSTAIVDQLSRLRLADGARSRREEMEEVCVELRGLAEEFRRPIFLLAQLNRNSPREDRKPTIEDISESDGIAQTADKVLALHLPKAEKDRTMKQMEIICLKNRTGPGYAEIPIWYDSPRLTFRTQAEMNAMTAPALPPVPEGFEELDDDEDELVNPLLGEPL